ncbi:hypothetical protein L1887_61335 [Cichorium endivia]|nr:hypothetical protein L1887_61335 [Cichorium endivia]
MDSLSVIACVGPATLACSGPAAGLAIADSSRHPSSAALRLRQLDEGLLLHQRIDGRNELSERLAQYRRVRTGPWTCGSWSRPPTTLFRPASDASGEYECGASATSPDVDADDEEDIDPLARLAHVSGHLWADAMVGGTRIVDSIRNTSNGFIKSGNLSAQRER